MLAASNGALAGNGGWGCECPQCRYLFAGMGPDRRHSVKARAFRAPINPSVPKGSRVRCEVGRNRLPQHEPHVSSQARHSAEWRDFWPFLFHQIGDRWIDGLGTTRRRRVVGASPDTAQTLTDQTVCRTVPARQAGGRARRSHALRLATLWPSRSGLQQGPAVLVETTPR
jgi:hypothetical protein